MSIKEEYFAHIIFIRRYTCIKFYIWALLGTTDLMQNWLSLSKVNINEKIK